MSSVAEIQEALSHLTTGDLQRVEAAVHEQYRKRNGGMVFDDKYGVMSEPDLIAEAEAAFLAYDREENAKTKSR